MFKMELVTRNSDGLKNFYDDEGRILFKKWLSYVSEPDGRLIRIQRAEDKLWNIIRDDGVLISRDWFEKIDEFSNGYALVKLKDKGYNFIDRNGIFLCSRFYVELSSFDENGFAAVKKKDRYNFIDKKGKYVFGEWLLKFERSKGDVKRIQRQDGLWNIVDPQMRVLSKRWFTFITPFSDGIAEVKRTLPNEAWSYLHEDGRLLTDTWFASVDNFYGQNGFARVQRAKDKHYNFIKSDGKLVGRRWFKYASFLIYSGLAKVQREDDKYNFVGIDGNPISEIWFDDVDDFVDGFAMVHDEGLVNFIDTSGKIVLDNWYSSAKSFEDGVVAVKIDGDNWLRINLHLA